MSFTPSRRLSGSSSRSLRVASSTFCDFWGLPPSAPRLRTLRGSMLNCASARDGTRSARSAARSGPDVRRAGPRGCITYEVWITVSGIANPCGTFFFPGRQGIWYCPPMEALLPRNRRAVLDGLGRILDASGLEELFSGPDDEAAFLYDLLHDAARGRSSAHYWEVCRTARRRGVTPEYVIDRAA